MKNKHPFLLLIALLTTLSGCQRKIFGIDEDVWTSLSEQQKDKTIEGYNKRRELALLQAQNKETPFVDIQPDSFSLSWNSSDPTTKLDTSVHIQSISSHRGSPVLTIGDCQFKVSPFSKMSKAWVQGQKVKLTKNNDSLSYPVTIYNLENKESVLANKKQ